MYTILIAIHIIICLALILSILMQSSKGEGLAGAFGGTSLSGAVFGGRGAATFLSKATSVIAIAFMFSCLTLTFFSPARLAENQQSALKQQLQGGQPPAASGEQQPSALPGEGGQTNQQGGVELPPSPTENTQKPPAGGQ